LTQTAERTAAIDAQVLAVCAKAGKPLARVTLGKDAGTTLYLLNHSIARLVKAKQLVTRGKGQPMRVGTPAVMAAVAASEDD
jgi:hypothetical protein